MRTGIFLIFLALINIAAAISALAGETVDPTPQYVLNFFAFLFCMFLTMDVIEFFKKLSK